MSSERYRNVLTQTIRKDYEKGKRQRGVESREWYLGKDQGNFPLTQMSDKGF